MRFVLVALCLLACAGGRVRADVNAFAPRDYLKTAYDTLALSETDTDGHRIRAQLATREALASLEDLGAPARPVPFDGPPSLIVALELLERSQPQMSQNALAQEHTRRAVEELRAALH